MSVSFKSSITIGVSCFFFQAEDGIRDLVRSRGLGDVYKRQANIMEIKIPDPGCNNGDYAVGAVEYYKGQVYIGVTCTAENSKNQADCIFHIYEFNLLTKTFNLIFSTPFAREYWLKTPGTERPVSQLSLIHISEPRDRTRSRMPSSA